MTGHDLYWTAACPALGHVIHLGEDETPVDMIGFEVLIAGAEPGAGRAARGDKPIGLLHTGGTTNAPEAVIHSCNSIMSLVLAFGSAINGFVRTGTRQLQITPTSHISGVGSILTQLCSAGRAAVHAEVRIVDERDADVPTGTLGEILLRGPGMMLGYWDDLRATEGAMRGGWMHTGDVGRLDENGSSTSSTA